MEDKYNYYNRLVEKHGNIYKFNKETIKTSRDKVEFKCKKCNSISKIKLNTLLNSKPRNSCPNCSIVSKGAKETKEEKINKLKEKFPNLDFSKFIYTKGDQKSIVICPIHGEFEVRYRDLLRKMKYGCPKCAKSGFSSYEKEIVEYIKTFYNYKIEENTYSVIKNEFTNKWLELDIYLPDSKFAIEFNGKYWHSNNFKRIGFSSIEKYHNYKSKKCNDKNIKLIHIDEQEYIKDKYNILNNIKEIII